ncbi:MAG: acyl-CoA dehydrogenase family protein [Gammaproteobacteria bacterium]
MEFGWSQEQVEFRNRIRKVIERELPPDWNEIHRHGLASAGQTAVSKAFCAKLAEEGLLVRHWPREFGGGDGSMWDHVILGEEVWSRGEPRGAQYMNVNWLGPVLLRYASPEQKERFLPPIKSGSVVWCQLFSEPNAGSDLANMRTRAVPQPDGTYVVNGMKMWTSYARVAEWGFLLARTGQSKKEITVLLVKMDTPGITIKPFPGLVEDGHLHEIYFDNVVVPAGQRLGEEGRGWDIVRYALNFERSGIQRYEMARAALFQAVEELKRQGRFDDPNVQRDAGMALATCEAARLLNYSVVEERVKDLPPGPIASVSRLTTGDATMAVNDFMARYLPEVLCDQPVGGDWQLTFAYQFGLPSTIAAGAYEVQADIVATQELGLPRGG